jgi:membrane associated rhomboid family serine protease
MRFRGSSRPFASGLFSRIPPGVRWLLIANIVIFLVSSLTADRFDWLATFGLVPNLVVHGYLWQLFTYMFLHSTRSLGHILFNMLALWMFGSQLEQTWGTRRFLTYYTICGVGAGVCVVLVALLLGGSASATIGASGALFGLLLAYGMLFPDSVILFMLVFPIKAKYFVMIMGAIAFYMSVTGGNSGVSNVAHVGGLLVGFLYLKTRVGGFDRRYLERRLQEWKMQRAKRKFQVYMRKHGN